jgi:hypothetical protein
VPPTKAALSCRQRPPSQPKVRSVICRREGPSCGLASCINRPVRGNSAHRSTMWWPGKSRQESTLSGTPDPESAPLIAHRHRPPTLAIGETRRPRLLGCLLKGQSASRVPLEQTNDMRRSGLRRKIAKASSSPWLCLTGSARARARRACRSMAQVRA